MVGFLILDMDVIGRLNSGVSIGNFVWLGFYVICKVIFDVYYCFFFDIIILIKNGNKLIVCIDNFY